MGSSVGGVHAVLTPIVVPAWELRVFEDGKQFGDPYDFCALFKAMEHVEHVEVALTLMAPTPAHRRAMGRVAREHTPIRHWWRRMGGCLRGPFRLHGGR